MVPSMKRSSLPKISPLMVIPWLTQAGALGETGAALAASARVEEGAPYPGLSVADCSLLSSGFFHIRHLHGAGSAAAELGPVGQAGGSVRNHDDSTAPQGCKAKRMALAISCAPLRGKRDRSKHVSASMEALTPASPELSNGDFILKFAGLRAYFCRAKADGQSCRTTLRRELWTSSPPLYRMKPSFLNLFMKKLTRVRVVPI